MLKERELRSLKECPESLRDLRQKLHGQRSRYFASSEARLGGAILELSDTEALLIDLE